MAEHKPESKPSPEEAPISSLPQVADQQFSEGQARQIIYGLLLTIFLAAMDQTVVSIALLAIATDLKDASLMAWLISGYLVAATVTAPLYGKLSDIFGRRTMLLIAIGLYLVASSACALAQSMQQLLIFRVVQGIGGGGLLVLAHAAIADVVPGPQRGRYQGYFSGVFATAALIGPIIGGLLAEHVSWRAIFWINVPLGLAAFMLCERRLRLLNHQVRAVRVDFIGAALLTAGLLLILIALARVGQGIPWNSAQIVWSVLAGLAILGTFIFFESRTAEPIISPELMRNPTVMVCSSILALMFFILYGCAVLIPLSLQTLEQLGPGEVALRMLPHTLATPFGAFIAGRRMLTDTRYHRLIVQGAGLTTIGLVMIELHRLGLQNNWLVSGESINWIIHCLAVTVAGYGLGSTMPVAMVAVQGAVSRGDVGIATAVSSFFRQLGGAVGVAVLTAVLFAALTPVAAPGTVASGSSSAQLLLSIANGDKGNAGLHAERKKALSGGFQQAFVLCIGASLLGMLLAGKVPRR